MTTLTTSKMASRPSTRAGSKARNLRNCDPSVGRQSLRTLVKSTVGFVATLGAANLADTAGSAAENGTLNPTAPIACHALKIAMECERPKARTTYIEDQESNKNQVNASQFPGLGEAPQPLDAEQMNEVEALSKLSLEERQEKLGAPLLNEAKALLEQKKQNDLQIKQQKEEDAKLNIQRMKTQTENLLEEQKKTQDFYESLLPDLPALNLEETNPEVAKLVEEQKEQERESLEKQRKLAEKEQLDNKQRLDEINSQFQEHEKKVTQFTESSMKVYDLTDVPQVVVPQIVPKFTQIMETTKNPYDLSDLPKVPVTQTIENTKIQNPYDLTDLAPVKLPVQSFTSTLNSNSQMEETGITNTISNSLSRKMTLKQKDKDERMTEAGKLVGVGEDSLPDPKGNDDEGENESPDGKENEGEDDSANLNQADNKEQENLDASFEVASQSYKSESDKEGDEEQSELKQEKFNQDQPLLENKSSQNPPSDSGSENYNDEEDDTNENQNTELIQNNGLIHNNVDEVIQNKAQPNDEDSGDDDFHSFNGNKEEAKQNLKEEDDFHDFENLSDKRSTGSSRNRK